MPRSCGSVVANNFHFWRLHEVHVPSDYIFLGYPSVPPPAQKISGSPILFFLRKKWSSSPTGTKIFLNCHQFSPGKPYPALLKNSRYLLCREFKCGRGTRHSNMVSSTYFLLLRMSHGKNYSGDTSCRVQRGK